MRTKYTLNIDGTAYDIPSHDLYNWDEIQCAYKREDMGGVVRSFTTSFEFTGKTRLRLLEHYLDKGVTASAMLTLYTLDGGWKWREVFVCDLDFSTVKLSRGILEISCVDNSVAAIIKANKSVKYEFVIGDDIPVDCEMYLPRIPLKESALYEFTQDKDESGEPKSDGSIEVKFPVSIPPVMGRIGDAEVVNGGRIFCALDQWAAALPSADYCIQNVGGGEVEVTLDYDFRLSKLRWSMILDIVLEKASGSNVETVGTIAADADVRGINVYSTCMYYEEMPASLPSHEDEYIVVRGEVYKSQHIQSLPDENDPTPVDPSGIWRWQHVGREDDDTYSVHLTGQIKTTITGGERLRINGHRGDLNNVPGTRTVLAGQSFKFGWQIAAPTCKLQGIKPQTLLDAIVSRMEDSVSDGTRITCTISQKDLRLASTYLFPAELIREIPGAKLYTTFSNFCDWMEAVFGYVYTASSTIRRARFNYRRDYKGTLAGMAADGGIGSERVYDTQTLYTGPADSSAIYYDQTKLRFVVKGGDGVYYYHWEGESDFQSSSPLLTGTRIRTDCVFHNLATGREMYYGTSGMTAYTEDPNDWRDTMLHTIRFLHRTELFSQGDPVPLLSVREATMTTDTSMLFSSVEAGYKKKDYGSVSGRDEFNFSTTYTTGYLVNDKKLQLISPYRADSYGVEFCVQKRGMDTTDNATDQDVFFIHTTQLADRLYPTEADVQGTASDKVFNTMFTPADCILANKEYISVMAGSHTLRLKFSSSEGNSDVTVDGNALNGDIEISGCAIACPATVEMSSSKIPQGIDLTALHSFEYDGIRYEGYLDEVTNRYAKEESVKYKMKIKNISLC